MFKLKKYLRLYKKELILGPFFKLWEAVFELVIPLVMARIIDVGIKNSDTGYVLRLGGVIVLLGVIGLISTLVCQYFGARASQGIGNNLRKDLFSHILSLSHSEIDKLGTSTLITRITNDVNQIQLGVAMLIRLAVRAPFLVIGATVMAMAIDLKLSLVFLAAIPAIVAVLYFILGKTTKMFHAIQRKLDKISLITRENLSGVRVVRAFSEQDREKSRFNQANGDYTEHAVRVAGISTLLNPVTYLIMNTAIIAIIWFGGYRVESGALTQGQIIAFVNYMTQILLALVVVANILIIFTKANTSSARVMEIFNTENTIKDEPCELTFDTSDKFKVKFENVSFSYNSSDNKFLKNISFKVKKGQTIGIIGGTGAGKTTLINLIPRFYEATEGSVLVDGKNVKSYPVAELRNKIAVVPQKAVLFSGSVRDNLRWGKADATDDDIMKAVKYSQSSDFISSAEDLDKYIFQGGRNLSGGQKQRLTIARALVKEPEILILDDSASALDYTTDLRLRTAIKNLSHSMTVFIVSQRAASVMHADIILVLDNGELVGAGTHDQLIKTCGEYIQICHSQMSGSEAENER